MPLAVATGAWAPGRRTYRQPPRHTADYMAKAAEAKVNHDERAAHAFYEVADAFKATKDLLDLDETDDEGNLMVQEPLAASPPRTPHAAKKQRPG